MRAVWSFWTKPFAGRCGIPWPSEKHHLLSWILSVETARKHYPQTALVTDEEGADLLVDRLGLEFTHVSTELSALSAADPEWWVLGKLWTYRLQREPFIHIDNDVYLWGRLPRQMEAAPVFAQNPEWFPLEPESWYRPRRYTQALQKFGGWMPEQWLWAAQQSSTRAICCGILGGNDFAFLRYYADLAIRMIQHPRNRRVWQQVGANSGDNVLFEQYLLAACMDYHRACKGSPYEGVEARYLFNSMAEAFDEEAAVRAKYTHLIGGAKSNASLARSLENRVAREYPKAYERCCALKAPRQLVAGHNGAHATQATFSSGLPA
jgi:hypothetical protein